MAATLIPAPTDAVAMMDNLIALRFPDLVESNPHIKILFAVAKGEKPALKHGGNPCLAKIKVIGTEQRRAGGPDVLILVDAASWTSRNERAREAILHHELLHLVLKRDKKDRSIKRDDMDRPMFGTRPDDYAITGFVENARIYGDDSPELRSYRTLREIYSQGEFSWGDDMEAQVDGNLPRIAGVA